MARGIVSTLVETSTSALKIWCDGSDGPLCFDGVAVVGADVLLRFANSNGIDGSHEL